MRETNGYAKKPGKVTKVAGISFDMVPDIDSPDRSGTSAEYGKAQTMPISPSMGPATQNLYRNINRMKKSLPSSLRGV
jgi:hypothetical protein